MKALLYIAILISVCGFAPPTVDINNDGVDKYKADKHREAFEDFVDALSRDSNNPILHFNLANSFYKNGENQKALTEFDAVEGSSKSTPELKYQAMFNAGNVAVEMKDFDRAMKYYQRALSYKPDSVETKTNIELALKEQQGGGGGGGDKKDNKDNKDDKDKKDQKDEKDDKDQKEKDQPDRAKQHAQPKPFKSQNLNEDQVRRILEELKRQEQEIRAKQNKSMHKTPESQIDKDW